MLRCDQQRGLMVAGWLAAVCVVASGAALALAGSAGRADGAVRTDRGGVIAFEARSGLYIVDAAGGQPRRIPGSRPGDGDPRWSPDGQLLSFDRERGDNWDVWVMNADGSDQRQLTLSPAEDDFAEWAPNGRWLAFLSKRDGPRAVYAISTVTGGAWRVTEGGQFPDWTPDGRIVYTQPGVGTVFTVRPNGSHRRPLPTQPGDVLGVRVSNDGQKLVYATHGFDIYSAGIDGTGARRLTASSQAEDDPVWSPDGQWITFDKGNHASGLEDVYVMRADGSAQTRLTSLRTACCPDWGASAPP